MKNENALLTGDSVENFMLYLESLSDSIIAAAEMLQRLYLADNSVIEKLATGPRAVPEGFLNGLLKIAEKALHPALLMNRCPAYRKVALLPYSAQCAAVEKGKVDLVVGPGEGDVILVDLVKLDGPQLNQVIGSAGVRSRDEQRAYLRQRSTKTGPTEKIVGPAYQIKRDKLVFLRPCEVSKVEILRLLEEMVS